MISLLQFFILIPLTGFVITLFLSNKKETLLSQTAFFTVGAHFLSSLLFVGYWLLNNHPTLDATDIVVIKVSDEYKFFLDFCFDKITAAYLLVGSFLMFLITIYSRYYLHRESGYKRFFYTVLFFYTGYNIAIFSGNFETLFIGWEILGISSFLLIAFYRERYLPVKNAMKIFSLYRLGDAGLIIAMWLTHHLWHENITFLHLRNFDLVAEHLHHNYMAGLFISLMVVLAATVKSAQFPFSSWLPRAMEGPTPSSAIFYGSLAANLGVFLLLRTFPFWDHLMVVKIIVIIIGLKTSVIATLSARVQSSVKSQIAYSSIAQIGLIFIETALGFHHLALIHFAGNAFLRTYQLLVSPSVVSYLIREQFYNFVPREHTFEDSLPKKIEYSIYTLSLKEWNLDSLMYRFLWSPFKWIGQQLTFISLKFVIVFSIPIYLIGLYCIYNRGIVPLAIIGYLPLVFSFFGFMMVLKSFAERNDAQLGWILVVFNYFWIALAIAFNEPFNFDQIYFYLSGALVSGIVGLICIRKLTVEGNKVDMTQFHGLSAENPKMAGVFLIACLGLAGFPITPTFIGVDLLLSHINQGQVLLLIITALNFVFTGLSLIRMYARIFLGPDLKTDREIPYRSS